MDGLLSRGTCLKNCTPAVRRVALFLSRGLLANHTACLLATGRNTVRSQVRSHTLSGPLNHRGRRRLSGERLPRGGSGQIVI